MPHIMITGGAGFIGSHTAYRYLSKGWRVTVFDNMSRLGTEHNLDRLRAHPNAAHLRFVEGDVRDADAIERVVQNTDAILHAAGQTAVTTSVRDPRADFEANMVGTLNLLEAVRLSDVNPVIIYTSTNKVYGGMPDAHIALEDDHYTYTEMPYGVPETQPLDFHSPYGCSKGAGDQYTRDYARIYGLRTVVLRQSCIYGTWQFGVEDQGWVAFFSMAALLGFPLTLYGDGKQVRDVLYIDDLLDAYERIIARADEVAGEVFNIGGGPRNAINLLDLIELLGDLRDAPVGYSHDDWRPGDQRVYVSDTRRLQERLGWQPAVGMREGVTRMFRWMQNHQHMIESLRERAVHG